MGATRSILDTEDTCIRLLVRRERHCHPQTTRAYRLVVKLELGGACIALVCSSPLHAMASSDSTMMMPIVNKIHERYMKLILEKLYKNLEKQLLVLTYLEEMDADGGVHQESVVHEIEIADVPLAPQAYKYSGWKKSLLLELFAYVEPRIWHMARHQVV